MTLTPEHIAAGWRLHDGSAVCPIKDDRTRFEFMHRDGCPSGETGAAYRFGWIAIIAYRIIEAHGADAEPARPTPFPASMADLVYDADGMSQPFFTGGVWPEWLPDDAPWQAQSGGELWESKGWFTGEFAIRVRRREPKRETVKGYILSHHINERPVVVFDLIDGKPDLSTLKIAEDTL